MSSSQFLATEELVMRSAIYRSTTDSLIASLIDWIPDEEGDDIVMEHVDIMSEASRCNVAAAIATAANMQLVRRDSLLQQALLPDHYISRTRTAPFHRYHMIGAFPRNSTGRYSEMISGYNKIDESQMNKIICRPVSPERGKGPYGSKASSQGVQRGFTTDRL